MSIGRRSRPSSLWLRLFGRWPFGDSKRKSGRGEVEKSLLIITLAFLSSRKKMYAFENVFINIGLLN